MAGEDEDNQAPLGVLHEDGHHEVQAGAGQADQNVPPQAKSRHALW